MCVFGDVYEETAIDQVCKLAREKNQKYQKKRFQTILSSDKVNFRGHQKALMRIMDGTSRRMDTKKHKENKINQGYMAVCPDEEKLTKWDTNKNKSIRQQEDQLRAYEEKVFIDNIVESTSNSNRRQFAREYDEIRQKYQKGSCPFYNGGEKRVFETELNVNPYFEKMTQRLLVQPVHDIEDLTRIGRQHQCCPYYLARSKLANVDIAVVPYNYILTPSIRKKLPLTIENSILIFDEAHNLERTCEEIMSFKLSVEKLIQCDRILAKLEGFYREKDYMSAVGNGNSDKTGDRLDDTELLRVFIDTLRKTIDNFPSYNRHN